MVSPACAVKLTPELSMFTELLKLMRCSACKVTSLVAPEMVSAPMLVLPVDGMSLN